MDYEQRRQYLMDTDPEFKEFVLSIEEEERVEKHAESLRGVALVFFLLLCIVALYIWFAPLLPEGW